MLENVEGYWPLHPVCQPCLAQKIWSRQWCLPHCPFFCPLSPRADLAIDITVPEKEVIPAIRTLIFSTGNIVVIILAASTSNPALKSRSLELTWNDSITTCHERTQRGHVNWGCFSLMRDFHEGQKMTQSIAFWCPPIWKNESGTRLNAPAATVGYKMHNMHILAGTDIAKEWAASLIKTRTPINSFPCGESRAYLHDESSMPAVTTQVIWRLAFLSTPLRKMSPDNLSAWKELCQFRLPAGRTDVEQDKNKV